MMTKSSSPRYESYFDMHCQPNLTPTWHFQRAWKAPRPSSPCSSILWSRQVIYVSHQTVRKPHVLCFFQF
jgi:hypothetical protein